MNIRMIHDEAGASISIPADGGSHELQRDETGAIHVPIEHLEAAQSHGWRLESAEAYEARLAAEAAAPPAPEVEPVKIDASSELDAEAQAGDTDEPPATGDDGTMQAENQAEGAEDGAPASQAAEEPAGDQDPEPAPAKPAKKPSRERLT